MYFRDSLENFKITASNIDELYEVAVQTIETYTKHMSDTGPVGQIGVYLQAQSTLRNLVKSAQNLRMVIDKEEIKKVFSEVAALLPPVNTIK